MSIFSKPLFAKPLRALIAACSLGLAACSNGASPATAQDLALGLFADPAEPAGPQLPAVPARSFTEESPATILVIGDSLGFGIGVFLQERAAERGIHARVINVARSSTGLSRKDYYNWPAAFERFAASEAPDIVVAHFGATAKKSATSWPWPPPMTPCSTGWGQGPTAIQISTGTWPM